MRFFYNFYGKLGEFRLWDKANILASLKYRGRFGPLTIKESNRILAYYRFTPVYPYGRDFFLYDTLTAN